ncbi:MAG: nitroreductase family deazaflavin-dependent oxidoreductase [Actinomycetota bacterium]|nr:nitroreductase family deazaflavin-dependent oxidoreductase [Actinomycetota bacterium]
MALADGPDRRAAAARFGDRAQCRITTTGRRTGKPHTITIWFAHHQGTIYLLSGGRRRSDWVRNLIAHPGVVVRFSATEFPGRARLVDDPTEDRLARDLVHDKYVQRYRGSLTRWRQESLPVAIDLEA